MASRLSEDPTIKVLVLEAGERCELLLQLRAERSRLIIGVYFFLVELHSRTAARHLCSEDCISLSTYSKYERSHKPAQKEGLSSGREVSYAGTRSFPESNSMSCIAKLLGGCRFQS